MVWMLWKPLELSTFDEIVYARTKYFVIIKYHLAVT